MANKLSDIDWFRWNGVKCTEYGLHVLEQPTLLRPKERILFHFHDHTLRSVFYTYTKRRFLS